MRVRSLLSLSLLIIICVFQYSCTSQKKLRYFENLDTTALQEFNISEFPEYRIQQRDILYIRFVTMNDQMNDLLNVGSGRYSSQLYQNETSLYINGYTVNDSGDVVLPILGEIHIVGLSIDEAQRTIQKAANKYLKDASVIVKLISFKFTVIGEVNRPGTYTNFNNQLTVLEAIGMAGDITDYGNRSEVLVVRPSPSTTTTYKLNLQDKKIIESKAFFILPNDIVIVDPIKSKPFHLNIPTMTLILSTVSTLILVLSFINN